MSQDQLAQPRQQVRPDEIVRERAKLLPPYKVIVHNDDYNEMNYVIFALMQAVNTLTAPEAERIMLTAHIMGRAIVTVCPKEVAEYYQERLSGYNLTASIEPD